MRRRAVLRVLATLPLGLAGCGGTLPGATGPRRPPESERPPPSGGPDVSVSDIDVTEAPDGTLRVVAAVHNGGGQGATRTVTATATVEGEEYVRSTQVHVGPNATVEATLDFAVSYESFLSGGSVTADVT